jgi:hypothetical protein
MSNAWLITWDGAGAHAQVKDKIVAILSPEKSVEEVAAITEMIYSHFTSTVEEMVAYATEIRANPYPSRVSANKDGDVSIICGHNPYLEAYLVRRLQRHDRKKIHDVAMRQCPDLPEDGSSPVELPRSACPREWSVPPWGHSGDCRDWRAQA